MITLTPQMKNIVRRRLKKVLQMKYEESIVDELLNIPMSEGVYNWVSSYTSDTKTSTLTAIYYSNIYRIIALNSPEEEVEAFRRRLHTGGALP